MGLFKRNRRNTEVSAGRKIITEQLGSLYKKAHAGWANWMAEHTATLTKKDVLMVLTVFVLLIGGYSSYLLVNGFTGSTTKLFTVATISKPAHAVETGEVNGVAAKSDLEYKRIKRFHNYMDSLKANPAGKKIYDSIITKRPGLMDSLRQVEHYYYEQSKQKYPWKKKK